MAAIGGFPSYRNDTTIYAADGTSWRPEIRAEFHPVDGFTLWATDRSGNLVHQRYIGYTTIEARRRFLRWLSMQP